MRPELLEEIKDMIPTMKKMVDDDLAITVWDRTGTTLFFEPAQTFPLHFDLGFTIPDKNDKIYEAMNTGKTIHNELPREIFGVAIAGNLVPVFDNGEVVGCITCVFSVEEKRMMKLKSEQLSHTLEESRDSISQILNTARSATDYLRDIHVFVEQLNESFDGVLEVLKSIKGNASKSKILALNASIESARAGKAGLGFNIVAKEMSHLSELDAKAASKIEEHLSEMTNSVAVVRKAIQDFDSVSSFDAKEVEDILEKLMED